MASGSWLRVGSCELASGVDCGEGVAACCRTLPRAFALVALKLPVGFGLGEKAGLLPPPLLPPFRGVPEEPLDAFRDDFLPLEPRGVFEPDICGWVAARSRGGTSEVRDEWNGDACIALGCGGLGHRQAEI